MAYRWDEKTKKLVKDDSDVNASTAKSAMEKQITATQEVNDEWQNYLKSAYAKAAVKDYSAMNRSFPGYSKTLSDYRYRLGGSAAIENSGVLPKFSTYGQYAPIISGNIAAGKDYLGLTDKEVADYQAYLDELAKEAAWNKQLASARTGGFDAIDTDGMKKKQVQELGRAGNLSARDTVYEKLQQNPDQEFYEHNYGEIFGDMTEKEYLDELTAYLRNERKQNAAQAKYDKWKSEADAEIEKIEKMPGYEANSKYMPDNEYMYPDVGFLEGYDHYTDKNGVTLSASQYRDNAVNATLAALVDAGSDPAKRSQLESNIALLPEINNSNYNIEAIPYMTDDQRAAFFAKYNSGDTDGARQFLKTLDYGLQKERVEDEQIQRQEYLKNAKWWELAIDNAATVPANLLAEAQGAALAVHGALNPEGLKEYHEYNPIFDTTSYVQDVRGYTGQKVADNVKWADIPGTDMNLARMGYNALMSGADSLANSLLFRGAPGKLSTILPTAAMGAGAFTADYQQSQDYLDALASGAIEAGTEYLPFDIIGSKAIRPGAKVAYNMLAEGLGESTAELLNIGYDTVKNGANGEAQARIDELLTQGYTPDDALKQVVKEFGLRTLESGITGAMSGASAAPVAISEYSADKKTGKNIRDNEALYDLADLAETLPVSKTAKSIAERIRSEQSEKAKGDKAEAQIEEAGVVTTEDAEAEIREVDRASRDRRENAGNKKGTKAVSNAEIGYMYRETMRKLDKEAQNIVSKNFSRDIRNELEQLGYEGDSKKASEAIARFATGEITQETEDIILSSKVAYDIAMSYVDKLNYRNSLYDKADSIVKRASKDYVKPEATKAEKGAEEATEGIEDRANIAAEDIEVSDAPESMVDGKAVVIESVASVDEDGGAVLNVRDEEGNVREVSAEEVSFGQNDDALAVMIGSGRAMGRNAETMISLRNEDQDASEYANAYRQAMQYGEDGRSIEAMRGYENLQALTDEQLQAAYTAGRENGKRRSAVFSRKSALGVSVGNADTSSINMETLKPDQAASVCAMSNIAKLAGFNVRFVESRGDAEGRYTTDNGSWDPRTLTLTLDVHAGSDSRKDRAYAMTHTAAHELTHYIKQFADADLWNDYQEFVMGHLSQKETDTFNLDYEIESLMEEQGLSREDAVEEIMADASGEALNNIAESDIQSLAETNPGLLNKIRAFIKKWIGDLKKMISTAYKGTEAKTEAARQMQDAVEEMSRKWNMLFVNAAQNRAAGIQNENSTYVDAENDVDSDEVRYSRRASDDETRSIKNQIRNHADELNAMEPVANATSNPPETENLGELRQWAISELEKKGFEFDVADVGHIELSRSNIKRGLGYIGAKDRPTIAAIVTLPEVLTKGIIVGRHYDHKKNGFSTVTIGAPVLVNGVRGNMGVVITQTNTNHYKTHRVIMPDGSVFTFDKKTEATPHTRAYADVSDSAPTKKGVASENSIAQHEPDVKAQARRISRMSDREILADAMLTVANGTVEAEIIGNYRKRIGKLEKLQEELEEVNARIVELRQNATKATDPENLRRAHKEAMEDAHKRARELKERITNADKALISLESAKVLRDMVANVRDETRRKTAENVRTRAEERRKRDVQHAREVGQQRIKNLHAQREFEKYRKQMLEDVTKLHKWIASPTSKGSAPEFLRKPLAEFVGMFNFDSETKLRGNGETYDDAKFTRVLENLRSAVSQLADQQGSIDEEADAFMGYVDLPANFRQNFDANIASILESIEAGGKNKDTPINRMTAEQMKELATAFRILNHSIRKINSFISDGRGMSAKNAADETINDMNEMKARIKTNKALETLNSTFNWKNITPYYAFQRLGRGGAAMFERLQDGWDRMAENSAKVIEYARKVFEVKEREAWSREVSEVKLDSEETVQLTTAQKMSIYCLQKRQQAIGHLLGGGIRVADIEGKWGRKTSQSDNYVLTVEDINRITRSLTPRQREVADKLQNFMNTVCAEWGNDISMKRFGFRQMTEMNYFPIETDANNRRSIDETKNGKTSMFRLLNMSSLKPLTPRANNAIVIHDIFDVFSDHASDMAKYNALALPILDFIKWYNHVEKSDIKDGDGHVTGQIKTRSVQKALERVYGKDAKSYLITFIRDLNAEHDGGRNDGLFGGLISKAKSAAVGANLRVYSLQVTSLPRAAFAINGKYLIQGAAKLKSLNPVNAIKGTEAQDKVGILKWKSLGFYSTDIARSTRDMVKGRSGFIGKVRDGQMAPAGWGDNWVSNIIYEAVKAEMKDKHGTITPGSATYNAMVNRRVREIVYKTQVVDSTMTRSELMRSKGIVSMTTAFMSEPTLTVNMLNESIQKAVELGRKGADTREILRATGGLTVKAATVFVIGAFVSALMESAWDALRDDDEYETFREKFSAAMWGEKWYEGNFVQNLNPITMLPILNDAWSIMVEGYEDNSLMMQVFSQFRGFFDAIKSYRKGNTTLYNVIYKGLQTVSSTSGVGVANATRDGVALYNTFLAPAWGTPKAQTKKDSAGAAAKALYAAAVSGDTERFDKLTESAARHDITAEDLENQYNNLISDDYLSGDIDSAEAKRMIKMYGGKTSYQAQVMLDKLDYQKASGEKYADIEKNYVSGKTAKADAKSALTKYGDLTDGEADTKILTWDYEKATGRKYSAISNAYIRGEMKRSEIKNAMVKYGGKDEDGAEASILHLDYQIKTERPWSELMNDYHRGRFTSAQVKKFLMDYDQKDEYEAEDLVEKYDWAKKHGGSTDGHSQYITVHEAIDSGRGLEEAVEALVDKYTARGVTRKEVLSDIRTSITRKYKPIYLGLSESEQARMREELLDIYVYLGGSYNTYYKNMTKGWFE